MFAVVSIGIASPCLNKSLKSKLYVAAVDFRALLLVTRT
jgi:hypothetical protein